MSLCAQHQDIWLYSHTLQLLHRVLCRLGLQFISGFQVGYICQMHTYCIATQLPAQLTDSLHKWCTLNVADGTTYLSDHEVEAPLRTSPRGGSHVPLGGPQHPSFNLVGDVRHHLNRLAQIVAMTLTVYHRLIDAPCGDGVVSCGMYACKPLVVSQVQIGLKTISCHIAFAMLIGVQRTWVDVDVGVEFLNSHFVAACLQQLTDAGRYDSLTK